MRRVVLSLLIVGAVLAPAALHSASATPLASGCVTCLGKPTNDLWGGHFPLSGYQRYGKPWRLHFRLELLFISQRLDSDVELWPLVKALDQFGSWINVKPAPQACPTLPGRGTACFAPGFDLSHAKYRSRYVSFVARQLYGNNGKCLGHLPRDEEALLHHLHYRLFASQYTQGQACWNSSANSLPLPFVLVGGYLQAGPQIVSDGDFEIPVGTPPPSQPGMQPLSGLPFQTIHDVLASGHDPRHTALIYDVNSEANLVTALICHADGKQPRSACSRSVIKKLLRRVK